MFDRNQILRSNRSKRVRLVLLSMGVGLAFGVAGPVAAEHQSQGRHGHRVHARYGSTVHAQSDVHSCRRAHRGRVHAHRQGIYGHRSGHRDRHRDRVHAHGFGLGIFLPFLQLQIEDPSHHSHRSGYHTRGRRGSGDWAFVAVTKTHR
jgi:hypothetical protein